MTVVIEPQVAQFDIGDLLSSKRQQRQETCADVARETRLPEITIERLDSNDFDSIGPLVYVRGYLGLYARHLGLEADYVIEQYNMQYPAKEIALKPSAATSLFDERRQQSKRHSKTVSFLTAGLVVGGLAYGYLQSEALLLKKISTPASEASVEMVNERNVNEVLDQVEAAENLADDVLSGDTIAQTSVLADDFELDLVASPAARAAELQIADNLSLAKEMQLPNGDGSSAAITSAPAPLVEEEPAAPPIKKASARIRFAFKSDCWVKLEDGRGKALVGRVYKRGQSLDVTAVRPIKLVIGSPESVHAATIDGKAISLTDFQISKLRFNIPK